MPRVSYDFARKDRSNDNTVWESVVFLSMAVMVSIPACMVSLWIISSL